MKTNDKKGQDGTRRECSKSISCLTAADGGKALLAETLNAYAPARQREYGMRPEVAVGGDSPTLWGIRDAYGEDRAEALVAAQLLDFENFAMVREDRKPTTAQRGELAARVVSRYGFLKCTELLLFFDRLKYGDYGSCYGSVDPLRILEAVRMFLTDRAQIAGRIEERRQRREAEERKRRAVPMPEHLARRVEEMFRRTRDGGDTPECRGN